MITPIWLTSVFIHAIAATSSAAAGDPKPAPKRCIAIVGTSDIHGAIEPQRHGSGAAQVEAGGLLVLSGYLEVLRQHYPDRLLLLDAGDLFQGTMPSNLSAGEAIIAAHNLLGYSASALGNHDFDFGALPDQADPLGVLKARIAQAKFPFLSTNLFDRSRQARIDWPNTTPSLLRTIGGVRVGIVGATTPETAQLSHPHDIAGLEFQPPLVWVRAEAQRLRQAGAELVVLSAHLGGHCTQLAKPRDLSSCSQSGSKAELLQLLQALPTGTIDVAIGGHSHHLVAHWINGTATLQSGARGEYFGWVDACVGPGGGIDPLSSTLHGAVPICLSTWSDQTCRGSHAETAVTPAHFLGQPVQPMASLVTTMQPYLDSVAALAAQPLAVELPAAGLAQRVLVGLAAEAMRRTAGADFGIETGGGVRTSLPAGSLRYAHIFQALPFDNRIVRVPLRGQQITALLSLLNANLSSGWGGPVTAGLRLTNTAGRPSVTTAKGSPLQPDRLYTLAMTDYLFFGGDGAASVLGNVALDSVTVFEGEVRRAFIALLTELYPLANGGA